MSNYQPSLSKSRYVSGLQCPKMLWMRKNMPDEYDDSAMNQVVLDTGNEVGNLAMQYFGEFTKVEFLDDKKVMVEETERLMKENTAVITEAAFIYKGDLCIVDILRAVPGGYEIIEVKSSNSSPGDTAEKVKEVYLHDMTFQAYILKGCGINIKSVKLMSLNRKYVRNGELDIKELFVLTDCTTKVFKMMKAVPQNIKDIKAVMSQENEPVADIGGRCDSPYTCGFINWCYKELPEKDSIFHIGWSMRMNKKEQAYKDGIFSFQDALAAFNDGRLTLNNNQLRQVELAVNNLEPQINKAGISDFLSTVKYPLYYLDFETFQAAIPLWDGSSPYKKIVFQYSLHIQTKRGGEVTHKEYLGRDGLDPRREIAEKLCADIPMDSCTISYNMSFEKAQINEMALLFPELSNHLKNINANMIDLMDPFKAGDYYSSTMGGGYSIKNVLPSLVQGDPELDYNNLDERVQNGGDAMDMYPLMHLLPQEEKEALRKALLAYCRLDTLAMVKILDKLYEIVE